MLASRYGPLFRRSLFAAGVGVHLRDWDERLDCSSGRLILRPFGMFPELNRKKNGLTCHISVRKNPIRKLRTSQTKVRSTLGIKAEKKRGTISNWLDGGTGLVSGAHVSRKYGVVGGERKKAHVSREVGGGERRIGKKTMQVDLYLPSGAKGDGGFICCSRVVIGGTKGEEEGGGTWNRGGAKAFFSGGRRNGTETLSLNEQISMGRKRKKVAPEGGASED